MIPYTAGKLVMYEYLDLRGAITWGFVILYIVRYLCILTMLMVIDILTLIKIIMIHFR